MIAYVRGTLAEKEPTRVVVEAAGLGYEVLIPLSTFDRLPKTGEEVKLLAYHAVREDDEGPQRVSEIPFEDVHVRRNEVWQMTHGCLKSLWNDDPAKAYVLLFKTRHHLSSEEVRQMLDLPSVAAVDQMFSRAVKAMRAAWVRFETKGVMA